MNLQYISFAIFPVNLFKYKISVRLCIIKRLFYRNKTNKRTKKRHKWHYRKEAHMFTAICTVSVNLKSTRRCFSTPSLLFLYVSCLSAWLHNMRWDRDSRIAERSPLTLQSNFLFSLLTAEDAQFAKPERKRFHLMKKI